MKTGRTAGGTAAGEPRATGTPTTDRLRGEIDAGLAGDKHRDTDPAAAPLGTDDEAAGTPAAPTDVATARREEIVRRNGRR